jgi:ATP-binding cassette subfamily F protein uup
MGLISLQDVSLAFGGPRLFESVSLQLEAKERVALLGRNGSGKSTLLKVLAGELGADQGLVTWQKGLVTAYLPQEVPQAMSGSVFDVVASGLGSRAGLISEYHHISHRLHSEHTPSLLKELDRLQAELDRTRGWELDHEIEHVISKMSLPPQKAFDLLSGGEKRRALLARALVLKPDVLLLDEPTNHLDIDAINWLEGLLKDYPGTVFFVTHDRVFMEHLATRIMELEEGRLLSWPCHYTAFLERKAMVLKMEAAKREDFDRKLAQEEVWIRRGVEARRCRNEGRVKALLKMRDEKKSRRAAQGMVRMSAQEADPSGHLVLKASRLGLRFGEKCLVRDFSTNIMRGDRVGVIGPNGSGKTSLLRVLLGELKPHKGTVRFGTELKVAYFDQLREELDENMTVAENVCGPADTVVINGKPRHIIGYLENFLFSADRARTPVKVLSGGERNRLLLARLFTKPFNFLVMDEPTNDLDIETLELLEEVLLEYSGTLILVSHDRAFLNNVVTSTIVLEGQGEVNEYVGGYDDWLVQRADNAPRAMETGQRVVPRTQRPRTSSRLSFRDSRELENLPGKIASLEIEQEELCAELADVEFYRKSPEAIAKAKARSEALAFLISESYKRWQELEALKEGLSGK